MVCVFLEYLKMLESFLRNTVCWQLDFQFLVSRTLRMNVGWFYATRVCGNLSQHHREVTHTQSELSQGPLCCGFRWDTGPSRSSPGGPISQFLWGEQGKEQKEGERRKPDHTGETPWPWNFANCADSTPKALLFTLYAANCYSLTRSRHQCHIFRSISWFFTLWTPPEMSPLLTALLFPPRTWTICNNGPAATCSLPLHPHLDSSSVKVPSCLSTHVLVPFTLAVSCWTGEPPPPAAGHLCFSSAVLNLFSTRDWIHRRQFFYGPRWRGRSGDDSILLHLLCTLFLLLLHCDTWWNNCTVHSLFLSTCGSRVLTEVALHFFYRACAFR